MGNVVFQATGREIGGWAEAVSALASDGALDQGSILTGEGLQAEIEEGGLELVKELLSSVRP